MGKSTNTLCLSLHQHRLVKYRHYLFGHVLTESLYVSCGNYCSRAFNHNLQEILAKVCHQNAEYRAKVDWKENYKYRKITGHQYHLFQNIYFADLKLSKIDLPEFKQLQEMEKEHTEMRWIKRLTMVLPHYRSRQEFYDYINDEVAEYYKSKGIREYDDQFLKYIIDNELEDEPLEDNLQSIDNCVLLDFDEFFPMPNTTKDKDLFIFSFIKQSTTL